MATLQTAASPDRKNAPPSGLPQRIWTSLHDSIGEIVFGMEDGTVSIFGLVFGVAASAPDATTVLLGWRHRSCRGRRFDDGRHLSGCGVRP